MSPLITSQNMDEAYIIDDLLFRGAQQRRLPRPRLARGDISHPQSKGEPSGTDPEAEGTVLPWVLLGRSLLSSWSQFAYTFMGHWS